jgi:hypothetical protein
MNTVIFFPASRTPVRRAAPLVHSPTWHEAMRQAANCRELAVTGRDRQRAIAMSAFFLNQARRVRERDRYLVGAL